MPTLPVGLFAAVAPALQVSPGPAGPLALAGTLLLGWAFFAFTAQVAASFFLADPPWRRAAAVGAPAAVVSAALITFDPAVTVAAGLAADAAAIYLVYDPGPRTTVLMTAFHYAITVALVIAISTLLALFATAPA